MEHLFFFRDSIEVKTVEETDERGVIARLHAGPGPYSCQNTNNAAHAPITDADLFSMAPLNLLAILQRRNIKQKGSSNQVGDDHWRGMVDFSPASISKNQSGEERRNITLIPLDRPAGSASHCLHRSSTQCVADRPALTVSA